MPPAFFNALFDAIILIALTCATVLFVDMFVDSYKQGRSKFGCSGWNAVFLTGCGTIIIFLIDIAVAVTIGNRATSIITIIIFLIDIAVAVAIIG